MSKPYSVTNIFSSGKKSEKGIWKKYIFIQRLLLTMLISHTTSFQLSPNMMYNF